VEHHAERQGIVEDRPRVCRRGSVVACRQVLLQAGEQGDAVDHGVYYESQCRKQHDEQVGSVHGTVKDFLHGHGKSESGTECSDSEPAAGTDGGGDNVNADDACYGNEHEDRSPAKTSTAQHDIPEE